jgi:cytochrome P450
MITFLDDVPGLDDRLQKVIRAEHLPRLRRNKSYDLRPLIETIIPLSQNAEGKDMLRVRLAARDAATGRPEELLDELEINFVATHVHREKLILIGD